MKTFLGSVFISILFALPFSAEGTGTSIGAPTKLWMNVEPSSFYLEWKLSPQDSGNVTGYEIMRSTEYRGPYERIATVGKGISYYRDSSVKPQVIYFYKVRAIAGNSHSPFSNVTVGDLPPH